MIDCFLAHYYGIFSYWTCIYYCKAVFLFSYLYVFIFLWVRVKSETMFCVVLWKIFKIKIKIKLIFTSLVVPKRNTNT